MPDSRSRTAIKKQVLSLLRNHGHKAFRPKEIAKTLGFKDNKQYKAFREVLSELERTNQVERVKGGRFRHLKKRRKHVVEGFQPPLAGGRLRGWRPFVTGRVKAMIHPTPNFCSSS